MPISSSDSYIFQSAQYLSPLYPLKKASMISPKNLTAFTLFNKALHCFYLVLSLFLSSFSESAPFPLPFIIPPSSWSGMCVSFHFRLKFLISIQRLLISSLDLIFSALFICFLTWVMLSFK